MVARLGAFISRVFARFMPDPFVIAVLLSVITLVLALTLGTFKGETSTWARGQMLLDSWRGEKGLWSFLAFSMQMCVVLVTGHALAASRPVHRLLCAVADRAGSSASGAAITALVGGACSLLNWGLGLIVGAILAREVGRSLHRRGVPHHYPLIVAAGFVGFLPWHGGLSGSAPLSMTSAAGMAKVLPAETIQALQAAGFGAGVPLSQTIFSGLNLFVTAGLLLLAPLVLILLSPKPGQATVSMGQLCPALAAGHDAQADSETSTRAVSPGDWLDRAWIINAMLAIGLLAAAAVYLFGEGAAGFPRRLQRVGLNEINIIGLAAGLLLHRSPRAYMAAIEDGARGCAGIIVQFPIYGGVVAMLTVSGLDQQIAAAFTRHADARSLPVLNFLCAGVINMFVPSGGGQWGVQGPVALGSGLALGVPPGRMIMSVAYGDQVTNMLQVFWALPLLAVCGARARDIVGYTTLVMLAAAAWVVLVLWLSGR